MLELIDESEARTRSFRFINQILLLAQSFLSSALCPIFVKRYDEIIPREKIGFISRLIRFNLFILSHKSIKPVLYVSDFISILSFILIYCSV